MIALNTASTASTPVNTPLPTLVLDCSFDGLAVGLHVSDKLLTRCFNSARGSTELHPALESLLAEANLTASQLGRIILTVGPGSFTGIRIGLAVAQAMQAVVPQIKLIGINTLQALAYEHIRVQSAHSVPAPCTVLIRAAGGDVYQQSFSANSQPTSPATCLPLADFNLPAGHTLITSSGLMLNQPSTPACYASPHALLALAENAANHLSIAPVYIKLLAYKTA
jgi:tRNA threonylcarbamoyl adenosine modification protein YeaZ